MTVQPAEAPPTSKLRRIEERVEAREGPALVDVALQAASQSLAFRIAQAFLHSPAVPETLRPAQAHEAGPHSEHHGPCTAVLSGISSSHAAFATWFRSGSAAWLRRMCTRVYLLSHFAASAHPCTSLDELRKAVQQYPLADQTLRLQVMPRAKEKDIADALQSAGCCFNPHQGQFSSVLSVIEAMPGQWRHGLTSADLHWQLTPDMQGVHAALCSSAVHKLDEALRHIEGLGQPASALAAADLGAAPGAWSEFLAPRCKHVVAVDPAALSEQCLALPNVRHVRKTSEATDEIKAALEGHELGLIACDMNRQPQFSATCIASLLPLLAPGGWVVMTLKLCGRSRDRTKTEAWLRSLSE